MPMHHHESGLDQEVQAYEQRLTQEEAALTRYAAQVKPVWRCPHCGQTATTHDRLRHLGTCPLAELQKTIAATRLILSELRIERARQHIGTE